MSMRSSSRVAPNRWSESNTHEQARQAAPIQDEFGSERQWPDADPDRGPPGGSAVPPRSVSAATDPQYSEPLRGNVLSLFAGNCQAIRRGRRNGGADGSGAG